MSAAGMSGDPREWADAGQDFMDTIRAHVEYVDALAARLEVTSGHHSKGQRHAGGTRMSDERLTAIRAALQDGAGAGDAQYIYPEAWDALDSLAGSLAEREQQVADAIELAEEGWGYAPAYFRDKWDYDARIAKLRAASPAEPAEPSE